MNELIERVKIFIIKQILRVMYFFVAVVHEVTQYIFSKSGAYARKLKAERIALAKMIK